MDSCHRTKALTLMGLTIYNDDWARLGQKSAVVSSCSDSFRITFDLNLSDKRDKLWQTKRNDIVRFSGAATCTYPRRLDNVVEAGTGGIASQQGLLLSPEVSCAVFE